MLGAKMKHDFSNWRMIDTGNIQMEIDEADFLQMVLKPDNLTIKQGALLQFSSRELSDAFLRFTKGDFGTAQNEYKDYVMRNKRASTGMGFLGVYQYPRPSGEPVKLFAIGSQLEDDDFTLVLATFEEYSALVALAHSKGEMQ
jgi:hypothetical protein